MELTTLTEAIENSWCKETSSDPENWNLDNPAWGQCAVTACVINDYLGGKIVWAEALLPDGKKISHYFNFLIGNELDLTRQQFPKGTVILPGIEKKKEFASTREYVLSFEVTQNRYELLKESVENYLEL
ncbi:hypothetical protein GOV03_02575 [Candidatus Woesearchaeota archaeon]|nr:hypothetical protein [Candidatus Woesearchaeota archaeon]